MGPLEGRPVLGKAQRPEAEQCGLRTMQRENRPRTLIRGAGEPGRCEQGRGAPRSWCSRLLREAGVGDMLAGAILAMWPHRECGL